MKIIITEQQLNNTIETLIRSVSEDVVSVSFRDKKVSAFSPEKGKYILYDRIIIRVVLDPHDILDGNIYTPESSSYITHRKSIQQALIKFMNIDTTKFMSPYDIEFYVLGTTKVKV